MVSIVELNRLLDTATTFIYNLSGNTLLEYCIVEYIYLY